LFAVAAGGRPHVRVIGERYACTLGRSSSTGREEMREDVEFDADGVTLRGWFYTPDGATGAVPTIVMAHGFSAVKEMYLDRFAEAFADAGLAALVYDNRNFGASDG
jgi:pimeloyl-ACP methyl ester carboxylesterase